jgi:hypothetical protein
MRAKPISISPAVFWVQRYWPDLVAAIIAVVVGLAWVIVGLA